MYVPIHDPLEHSLNDLLDQMKIPAAIAGGVGGRWDALLCDREAEVVISRRSAAITGHLVNDMQGHE